MSETFRMVPATTGSMFWIIGIIGILVLVLLSMFCYILYSSRNTSFEISPEGLRITGTLYGRLIAKDQIQIELVKAVNLNVDASHRPSWRTNGIGLPGYGAGWFQLSNGEKALLFLTDKSRVVYIPTTAGFSLMLSVPDTAKFIASLKKITAQ